MIGPVQGDLVRTLSRRAGKEDGLDGSGNHPALLIQPTNEDLICMHHLNVFLR